MGRNIETGDGSFERPGAREIARLEQRANEANRNVERAESRVANIRSRAEAARRSARELRARARQTTEQAGASGRQYTEAARRNRDQQRRLHEAGLPANAPELLRNAGEGAGETRGERTQREDREAVAAEQRAQMLSVDAALQEAEAGSLETELARATNYYERVRSGAADANYELVAALERSGKREEEIREQLRDMGLPANTRAILASVSRRGAQVAAPQESANIVFSYDEVAPVRVVRQDQAIPVNPVVFSDDEGSQVIATPRRGRGRRARGNQVPSPSLQTVAHVEASGDREPIAFQLSTQEYQVKRGDSLWKIAEKVYGKGNGNLYTHLRVKGKEDLIPNTNTVIHQGDIISYHPIVAQGVEGVRTAQGETPLRERTTRVAVMPPERARPAMGEGSSETPDALAGL